MPLRTYARIQDGRVAELLTTDGDILEMFNRALVWIDASSVPGIAEGWSFDGASFAPPLDPAPLGPPAPSVAELQAQIAALSAQLAVLSKTD